MAVCVTFDALQAFEDPIHGPIIVRRRGLHRKKSQLGFAKAADRDTAAVAAAAAAVLAAAPPETWLIPAVLDRMRADAAAQQQAQEAVSRPAPPAARPTPNLEGSAAFAAAVDAAAAKLRLSLGLELSPDEAQWLVQAPALPESSAPVPSPAPAPEQPAVAASPSARQHAPAAPAATTTKPPTTSLLASLRRGLRRLAGRVRRRLAATACMARPATL